jgi:hypothetical protein
VIDSVLSDMQKSGEIRADLNVQAIRSGMMGMLEGMVRDQVLAQRAGFPANYTEDDLRKMFALFLEFLKSKTSTQHSAVSI